MGQVVLSHIQGHSQDKSPGWAQEGSRGFSYKQNKEM